MAKKTPTTESLPIDAHRHKDTRKNIPTEELRDFVSEEENKPKTILYPRDPSLDPQLVWKGKDEQDQKPLEVPAVPIYIQEKIHPQAIIEDFRATKGQEQRRQSRRRHPPAGTGAGVSPITCWQTRPRGGRSRKKLIHRLAQIYTDQRRPVVPSLKSVKICVNLWTETLLPTSAGGLCTSVCPMSRSNPSPTIPTSKRG